MSDWIAATVTALSAVVVTGVFGLLVDRSRTAAARRSVIDQRSFDGERRESAARETAYRDFYVQAARLENLLTNPSKDDPAAVEAMNDVTSALWGVEIWGSDDVRRVVQQYAQQLHEWYEDGVKVDVPLTRRLFIDAVRTEVVTNATPDV